MVFPVMKNQWAPGLIAMLFDQADEQNVIAICLMRHDAAFENRGAALNPGHGARTKAPCHALEAVIAGPREPARNVDLILRQHVDGEMRSGQKRLCTAA